MFTTASDDNKQTHTALKYAYSVNGKVTDTLWEVHRYITKSYSFVGLTEAAAITVRDDKSTMYKRTYKKWDSPTSSQDVIMICDDIEANHGDGAMWTVDINVNEDDMLYTDDISGDLSLLDWPVITHDFDETA